MPTPLCASPWIRRAPMAARVTAIALLAVLVPACSDTDDDTSAAASTTEAEVPFEMSVAPSDHTADFTVTPWSSPLAIPTAMAFLPDGSALVTEKGGFGPEVAGAAAPARVVLLGPDGQERGTALTLQVCSEAERGLNGIALHPDFAENGYVFLYYTRAMADCHAGEEAEVPPVDQRVYNRLSRFTWDGTSLDPASETVLLDEIPSYQSAHNGGGLAFAPDGTLFVGVGESTLRQNSPNPDEWGGKLLRLDVDTMVPPADNPFAADTTSIPRAVVYATGLRNPFAFGVDPVDGRVIVADVGDEEYEEIDLIEPGTDYGWPEFEGPESTDEGAPVLWYRHGGGCGAIIGGEVSRNSTLGPDYDGWYVFGDFVCGRVWAAQVADGRTIESRLLATPEINLTNLSFGSDGALYLAGTGGVINRLTAA